MDAAPVMIWVGGVDKGCIWFNRPWLSFTGRGMAEELGNGWAKGVYHADLDRCLTIYVNKFDLREAFRMQYRLRRHDGEYRWIDDTGIPRFARDGTFLGYIGSCIDVHEHRETQAELRRRLLEIAELNRRADAAAIGATIAHEIKQPLAALIANADVGLRWLDSKPPNIEGGRQTFNNILVDGTRANQIIQSIGTMFKGNRELGAPLSLNELVLEVLVIMDSDLRISRINVRTALGDSLPLVSADRVQLQQVVMNLIKNSIDAMNSTNEDSRELYLRTEVDDSHNLLITIEDSGTGIDQANIERIFDRFFTTKSEGMGIGLSICRSIIEAHNGRIWAEPGVSKGSMVRICLPASG
jgi:PAS domain S-box-containing protein